MKGKPQSSARSIQRRIWKSLFEKFPDGFQIRITDISEDSEDSPSISYQLVLNGISETKEIKGEITKESSFENSDGKIEEEILYQGHVYYKDGSLHLSEGNSSKNKEKGDLKTFPSFNARFSYFKVEFKKSRSSSERL